MNVSEECLDLIKHFEGVQLKAYKCPASIWTIGYGHTAGVQPGDIITAEEADYLLRQDIAKSEWGVIQNVSVQITQNQFDALVSFVFNLGVGNFRTSTLLKKLNDRDYDGAAKELLRWTHVGGKTSPGLERRREAEKALFLE